MPTYNEADNIKNILPMICDRYPELSVLVVDDNSPDGTGQIAQDFADKSERIFVLHNPGKKGLGKAYLGGFQWAISKGFDFLIQMDADFSHRIQDLENLLEARKSQRDLVIGSRYIEGGGIKNWTLVRKLISRGGSFYARMILQKPIKDWTGGFNGWGSELLNKINFDDVQSDGYSFQIEMKYRALRKLANFKEVPILFEERRAGQSKMSANIFIEAIFRVLQIRFIS